MDVTDKLVSVFYGVMTPMINPLIYSLRNKDVKEAAKHLLRRKVFNKSMEKGQVTFIITM